MCQQASDVCFQLSGFITHSCLKGLNYRLIFQKYPRVIEQTFQNQLRYCYSITGLLKIWPFIWFFCALFCFVSFSNVLFYCNRWRLSSHKILSPWLAQQFSTRCWEKKDKWRKAPDDFRDPNSEVTLNPTWRTHHHVCRRSLLVQALSRVGSHEIITRGFFFLFSLFSDLPVVFLIKTSLGRIINKLGKSCQSLKMRSFILPAGRQICF